MVAPLEYVEPELFDEAVDRHHRSYVSVRVRKFAVNRSVTAVTDLTVAAR
jgi:hypothetical protein